MKNIKKFLITLVLSASILSMGGTLVHAYQVDPSYRPVNSPFDLEYKKGDPKSTNTIIILQLLSGALLYFAMPVAVIFIIIGGFNMAIGGAESEKIEQAKKHLTWSIIGIFLIILSYSAVRFIIKLIIDSAQNVK